MADLPYYPFTGETYKTQMGLKPLDLTNWIEIDAHFKEQVSRKSQIIRDHEDIAIGYLDTAADACFELLETVQAHLVKTFPAKYRLSGSDFHVAETGATFTKPTGGRDVMKTLAQLTQEDYCLMSAKPPVCLEAACVCFPSRWNLADKIGKDSNGIHKPVPKFETVAKSAETFLEKIKTENPMWRMNWTIHDNPDTFTPRAAESHKNLSVENVLQETFLRMERQTLRRLPKTGYVAFTIRTYVVPLAQIAGDAEKRDLLKRSLDGVPLDIIAYKGMKNFYPQLMQAL